MKKTILPVLFTFLAFFLLQACGGSGGNSSAEIENTDVVESGTYTGTAYRVDPGEQEIYVKTDDGKILELYFTAQTTVTQNGETVAFDALQQGQKLEVALERKGQRLEPVQVTILQQ